MAGQFGMPHVNIQQRVGAIVIKHTRLEHVLRICLKRLHDRSLGSPEYDKLMGNRQPAEHRKQIIEALAASKLSADEQKEVLQLIYEAWDLSNTRNSLAHDTWARKAVGQPWMLVDDKEKDKAKKAKPVPSMAELKQRAVDIDRVRKRLNDLTKPLLKP